MIRPLLVYYACIDGIAIARSMAIGLVLVVAGIHLNHVSGFAIDHRYSNLRLSLGAIAGRHRASRALFAMLHIHYACYIAHICLIQFCRP